jgi:crossover junction endodeoxyribonuclease RuvC
MDAGTMLILGIDPGSLRTGYGAIWSDGRTHRLVECGVLSASSRLDLPARLQHIAEGLRQTLERLRPQALAVEDLFHAANVRSALVLGHVRGVVLLAGAQAGIPIHAYAPATVKAQVTGHGRAEKAQVAFMVARHLAGLAAGQAADATDALAVALCHAHQLLAPVPKDSPLRARGPRA